jgi:hypothetical protein
MKAISALGWNTEVIFPKVEYFLRVSADGSNQWVRKTPTLKQFVSGEGKSGKWLFSKNGHLIGILNGKVNDYQARCRMRQVIKLTRNTQHRPTVKTMYKRTKKQTTEFSFNLNVVTAPKATIDLQEKRKGRKVNRSSKYDGIMKQVEEMAKGKALVIDVPKQDASPLKAHIQRKLGKDARVIKTVMNDDGETRGVFVYLPGDYTANGTA